MAPNRATQQGAQSSSALAVSPLPNSAVNPPHSAVTALAHCGKRRAAGRAGYRER
jgi:hypothetical protein